MREPKIYKNTRLKTENIDVAEHLGRRYRGAVANRDGRDFETIFALYKILEIAAEIFGSDEVDPKDPRDVTEYPLVLVDDLRTRDREGTDYYQLKHGRIGKTVILRDFARQRELDELNDQIASYYLVVDEPSRVKAAERWMERHDIFFSCYEFNYSLGFMEMARLHPAMRRWMKLLTGASSMCVWSVVFDLAHSKWRSEHDCYVVRFIRELASATSLLPSPLMSRELISEGDTFEYLMRQLGLEPDFEDRKLVLRLGSKVFLQIDGCVPEVFHHYNEWHREQEEVSHHDVRLKLLEFRKTW